MEVKKTDIKRFITSSDIVFVIPVYQRNYDWKKENCLQLFVDILTLVDVDRTHFIGTICHKMDSRYRSVIIDGQQRITSVMLLLKALYDITDDQRLKEKIKNQFLTNPYSDGDLKLKLKPIKKDEEVYRKLMLADGAFDEELFTKEECNSNIFRNYRIFAELIRTELNRGISADSLEDAVERLEVVEICLTDENPQVIFESLNSTGLGLTNTDLLRNYLLMSMDYKDQEFLYQNYWLQIENLLDAENMEQFMVHYLIMKRKSNDIYENGKHAKISSRNLYYAFKKQFSNIQRERGRNEVEACFQDMYRHAKYYQHFLFNDTVQESELGTIDRKLYELFYLLGAKAAAILVLYLYEKYDSDQISERLFGTILDICISFSFRSKVCNGAGFTDQFSPLIVQRLDAQPVDAGFLPRFWKAITSGRGRYSFPTNIEFRSSLTVGNVYQSLRAAGTKYFLYKLEQAQPHPAGLPPFKAGTVEHIMPQTLSPDWRKYLNKVGGVEAAEKYLYSVGNLALIDVRSSLSSKILFEEKKAEYQKSEYSLTKAVVSAKDWNASAIIKRGEAMSELALKIWSMDELYCSDSGIKIGAIYDLRTDFSAFVGTKPAIVSVMSEENMVSNWSDLVALVAERLYMLAPETFVGLLGCKNFPGKRKVIALDDTGMKKPHKIGESLYLGLNYDTEDLLNILKTIVNYIDRKDDTDFIDEIWFTIRRT